MPVVMAAKTAKMRHRVRLSKTKYANELTKSTPPQESGK